MLHICQDKKCAHCRNIKPSRATKYLQRLGGRLFQPIKSEEHEGHYLTFIETDAKFRQDACDVPGPDADQPSQQNNNLGVCTSYGCRNYTFLSAADKTRHYRLGHGGKRGMEREEVASNPKSSRLTCDKCSVSFVTEHRLKRHKKETGHKNPGKGRPKKK